MAKLDKEVIKNLTKLSRIACSEAEQEDLLNKLKSVLAYVEQLNEIDTDNVTPCNHVLESMVNVMREDAIGPTLPRETFLANAPAHTGGLIRVPPVMKNQ